MSNEVKKDAWSRGPYRVETHCFLRLSGPLRVGTGESLSAETDAPLLRDARGRAWLPGSSVRGVLRDWCEREAPLLGVNQASVNQLFGASERDSKDDRQGRLTVLDAVLDVTPSHTEVRDHVKIDRATGAAATGAKFDEELAIARTCTLRLVYTGDGPDDPELLLLDSALQALRDEVLSFGGKGAWGYGWCSVEKVTHRVWRREQPAHLAAWLAQRAPGKSHEADGQGTQPAAPRRLPPLAGWGRHSPPPWSWLRLDLRLVFDGPMLVAGPPRAETDADAAYIVDRLGHALLPGSSWRGVVHGQADRIAATLGSAVDELPATLFGDVKGDEGQRGLCRFGEGRLSAEAAARIEARQDHVAIDRFTGGAAGGRLFNTLALESPTFDVPLMVRWHHDRDEHCAALALLLFALRDLGGGRGWFGSRVTRGYGHTRDIEVLKARWSVVGAGGRVPGEWDDSAGPAELRDCFPIKQALEAWTKRREKST
jgi:CRISPR/Cas system CSM-associated protein Csm3 (group 7 of RAMP superfamily)